MTKQTLSAALDWMTRIAEETGQRRAKVTLHGGEPLAAGHAILRQAL